MAQLSKNQFGCLSFNCQEALLQSMKNYNSILKSSTQGDKGYNLTTNLYASMVPTHKKYLTTVVVMRTKSLALIHFKTVLE